MVRPLGPGGTATQEFPPRAAEWQRLRLASFSVSTLSELYIENRKRGEFFLYIFVGIACVIGGRCTRNFILMTGLYPLERGARNRANFSGG